MKKEPNGTGGGDTLFEIAQDTFGTDNANFTFVVTAFYLTSSAEGEECSLLLIDQDNYYIGGFSNSALGCYPPGNCEFADTRNEVEVSAKVFADIFAGNEPVASSIKVKQVGHKADRATTSQTPPQKLPAISSAETPIRKENPPMPSKKFSAKALAHAKRLIRNGLSGTTKKRTESSKKSSRAPQASQKLGVQ
eukprot:g2852.t1